MILFALALVSGAEAQSKFSARTLMVKSQQEVVMQQARRAGRVVEPMMSCFIKFSAPCVEQLKALGVKPQVELDGVMTAQVPVSVLDQVAALEQVTYVEAATPEGRHTDAARQSTKAYDVLYEGVKNGLPQNYDGSGVIIGVVDTGVDFQHPALRDKDGHSLCKMVYIPGRKYVEGKGGEQAKSGENVLSGVIYKEQKDLDSLTTDKYDGSHGTHVISTVVGREIEGFGGGVAPGAELIVAALGDSMLNNVVVNAMKVMADYAKAKNKRLVISKSLGSILGPHDGKSSLNLAVKGIVKDPNVILCQSAGNSGASNCYVHFTKDSLRAVMIDGVERKYWAVVAEPWVNLAKEKDEVRLSAQLWCDDDKPFDLAVLLYSEEDGLVMDEFIPYERFWNAEKKYFSMVHQMENKDSLEVYGVVNSNNGKYNTELEWLLHTKKNPKYLEESTQMGLMIFPRDENQEMRLWINDDYGHMMENHFVRKNPNNLVLMTGNSALSAGEDCCVDSVINVGNYVSKASYTTLDGKEHQVDGAVVNKINHESSYGTMLNKIVVPTVCGPGTMIEAAVNHLDPEYSSNAAVTKVLPVNGVINYYWAAMQGTSMSTPHVAGIMAQWLQANSKLTVEDIKKVLKETATPCADTDADKVRWGQYGRIEALKGIKYILQTLDIRDLQAEKALDAKGNVYNMNGQLVRSNVSGSDAVNGLPAGIYVVNGRKMIVR